MRSRAPAAVLSLLQQGDPLARLRELLAEAVEVAGELEDDSLEQLLASAVEEIDDAIERSAEGEEAEANRGADPGPMPTPSGYATLDEYRAAKRAWMAKKARATGPAIERGRVPRTLTRTPDCG